jgi:hypothetical protein
MLKVTLLLRAKIAPTCLGLEGVVVVVVVNVVKSQIRVNAMKEGNSFLLYPNYNA